MTPQHPHDDGPGESPLEAGRQLVSLTRRNILANFGGSVWAGLMGLVFVPLYIHFMGIEAYGLVGIFATLLGLFALLDMGLSGTLNRELARLSARANAVGEMRDLVRTLEVPYWLIGVLIAGGVVGLSPLLTGHWVKVERLDPRSVGTAIQLMGVCLAFQWPISFYSGGLMGLQRQVLLNGVNVAMATLRGLGAVLILWLLSPTVGAYFLWQIAISALHVTVLMICLWRSMPAPGHRPGFRRSQLASIWRFAAGMTAVTLMATILTQLDKVILSRMLSLEAFGYYALANVVATTLYRLVIPVYSATYPRLTMEAERHAEAALVDLYHRSCQLVSVLVLPAALVLACFAPELLHLWTRNPVTVAQTHGLVSLLVAGTAIHCLMHIPYALQLAHGWTKLTFGVNTVSVLILAPILVVLARHFGAMGAAATWLLLNLGYLLVTPPLMHRRLLTGEKARWYLEDVGRPLAAALGVALVGRLVLRPGWPPLIMLLGLGAISLATLTAAALAARDLRVYSMLKNFHFKSADHAG